MSAYSARALAVSSLLLLPACSSGGGAPTVPTPPPPPTYTVNALVFYDENGNGTLDGDEFIRVPGVKIVSGSASGVTIAGGITQVTGNLAGTQNFIADVETLPPGFVPGAPVPVVVPPTSDVPVPVPITLPIGDNSPNRYMGYGDSITIGRDGSSDGLGYRAKLEDRLNFFWGGEHEVVSRGVDGSKSNSGVGRIDFSLNRERPAYALIHYGTNDWNDRDCRVVGPPCFTIPSLTAIIQTAKGRQTIPVLATIIPVNVNFDARVPQSRQDWVHGMDEEIRALAEREGAILADMEPAFLADPDLRSLFYDHVHPNDKGYGLMADVWFRAITNPRNTPAPSAANMFARLGLFSPPGGTARGR